MARTLSTMLPLGTPAPDFSLTDAVSGATVSRANFDGQPLLVAFICNHCPFVKHVREEWSALANEYSGKGVAVVAINANDAEQYPDDAPERMAEEAAAGYRFPYLFDETQQVARAYKAACTPDFFVFDRNHELAYRGQMDDSRPGGDIPVTGKDLRAALDAVLSGREVPPNQKPSLGCNIKWKAGNEPEYLSLPPK